MRVLLLFLFFGFTTLVKGQYSAEYLNENKASVNFPGLLNADSVKVEKHSAKKATIYSAVLPGLGQIYNRNYLKAVLFDAGLVTAGVFMFYNRFKLREHRADLNALTDGDPNTNPTNEPLWSENLLIGERDFRLQNRNYSIIAMAAIYGLNILDANVSGHLYEFNINQKLTGSFAPNYQVNGSAGFVFNLRF